MGRLHLARPRQGRRRCHPVATIGEGRARRLITTVRQLFCCQNSNHGHSSELRSLITHREVAGQEDCGHPTTLTRVIRIRGLPRHAGRHNRSSGRSRDAALLLINIVGSSGPDLLVSHD
jgi:hypothetical protein